MSLRLVTPIFKEIAQSPTFNTLTGFHIELRFHIFIEKFIIYKIEHRERDIFLQGQNDFQKLSSLLQIHSIQVESFFGSTIIFIHKRIQ